MSTSRKSISRDSSRSLRKRARVRRGLLAKALPLVVLAQFLQKPLAAQAPTDKPANGGAVSVARPCPLPAADPKHKAKTKGKGVAGSNEAASACLEAKGSALEIQEFFQSYVREQAWRFGEEKIVADGWLFARYLDKNELLQFAREGLFAARVKWSEGKAYVQVTTRELDDGFTRVEITARFQGAGQSVDRFAPPRDSWDLDSNGTLEQGLIAALEAHLKSLH